MGDCLAAFVLGLEARAQRLADLVMRFSLPPEKTNGYTRIHPVRRGRQVSPGFGGVHTLRATPVPIPNTEVKPQRPMVLRKRESR